MMAKAYSGFDLSMSRGFKSIIQTSGSNIMPFASIALTPFTQLKPMTLWRIFLWHADRRRQKSNPVHGSP